MSHRPPSSASAPITWALALANALVFGLELTLGSADLGGFLLRWGLIPTEVVPVLRGGAASEPAVAVTLLSSLFLHAGWLHLAANLIYLLVFGPGVERAVGSVRFLTLYLVGGIVGGIAHAFANPASTQPALGASGAVAAVIAAHLALFPGSTLGSLTPVLFFSAAGNVPALALLVIWLVAQAFSGAASLASTGEVALWAHAAGFLGGLLMATLARGRRRSRSRFRA